MQVACTKSSLVFCSNRFSSLISTSPLSKPHVHTRCTTGARVEFSSRSEQLRCSLFGPQRAHRNDLARVHINHRTLTPGAPRAPGLHLARAANYTAAARLGHSARTATHPDTHRAHRTAAPSTQRSRTAHRTAAQHSRNIYSPIIRYTGPCVRQGFDYRLHLLFGSSSCWYVKLVLRHASAFCVIVSFPTPVASPHPAVLAPPPTYRPPPGVPIFVPPVIHLIFSQSTQVPWSFAS